MKKITVEINDEGEKGINNEFNNFCCRDDTYDDVNLAVGEGVSGDNNQEIAANIVAESTEQQILLHPKQHTKNIGNRD